MLVYIYVHMSVLPWGTPRAMRKHNRLIDVQYYDINVQHINVTGSMKLCNTKLRVVGHYVCCIPKVAYYMADKTSGMPCIFLVFSSFIQQHPIYRPLEIHFKEVYFPFQVLLNSASCIKFM